MPYKVEEKLFEIRKYLWKHCSSMDEADRVLYPLTWYCGTGRDSLEFDKALLAVQPFVVGRILLKGGSIDDTIKAIKKRLRV